MTEVSLADFQGISATFELGHPLTLVSGANGAGKTRIARAVAAVLSGATQPITGKKADLRECLTDGKGKARVVLRSGDALRAMVWDDGKCEPSVRGDQDSLPRASIYAAGLVSPLTLTGKDRAAAFAEIFKTEPTKTELLAAFKAAGLPTRHFDSLWEPITINGWDAIAGEAEKNARRLKGAWGEVTGATWGSNVAETWEPDAKRFPDPAALEAELRRVQEELEDAKLLLEQRKAERAAMPDPLEEGAVKPCPWCAQPCKVHFGDIVKVETAPIQSSADVKELRLAIAGADGKVKNAQDQIWNLERAIGAAQARLDDAGKARAKAIARAAELHAEILKELAIKDICGPAGLRQKKLSEVLGMVNQSLAALAKETGLPILEIDVELNATLAGTPYHRLSEAWSWVARTILQIETAKRDGSTLLVLDGIAVLQNPRHRNAVLSAICVSGIDAVVMQAAWDPADAQRTPDLEAAGYGRTYWIDHKHGLRPIAKVRAELNAKAA